MTVIARADMGTVKGFDITAYLLPDDETTPDDIEAYDQGAEDIEASWRRGDWNYVTVRVTAAREGAVLGEATIFGQERGTWIDGRFVDPLDHRGTPRFLNGYADQLIGEAILEAEERIARINGKG